MTYVPIFITLLCSVPIFITDAYMSTYFYNKNVPIITTQSPYFYNGLSRSVPIFINSRLSGLGERLKEAPIQLPVFCNNFADVT